MRCCTDTQDSLKSFQQRHEWIEVLIDGCCPAKDQHNAAHFLARLLHTDPAQRMTVDEALLHPFFDEAQLARSF